MQPVAKTQVPWCRVLRTLQLEFPWSLHPRPPLRPRYRLQQGSLTGPQCKPRWPRLLSRQAALPPRPKPKPKPKKAPAPASQPKLLQFFEAQACKAAATPSSLTSSRPSPPKLPSAQNLLPKPQTPREQGFSSHGRGRKQAGPPERKGEK